MRSGRRETWIVLAVAVLAGTLSVWATVLRLTSPDSGALIDREGFRPTGVAIERTEAATTGLRDGDLITAVAGRPMPDWAATLLQADRPSITLVQGESVQVSVDRANGPTTVPVLVGPPPGPATLLESWGTLAFVVALLAIAAFVFWRRPTSPAAGALLLGGIGAAGSTFPFVLGQDPLSLATGTFGPAWIATVPVYLLLWGGLIDFVAVFPRPLPPLVRRPWLRLLPYAGVYGVYLAALGVSAIGQSNPLRLIGDSADLTILGTLLAFAAMPVLAFAQWRTGPLEDRRLLRGFAAVMALIVSLDLVLWVGPELVGHEPILPASVQGVTGLPFPIVIAASILRYRAFDIDVVVRRSLVYGGLTVGVLLVYSATVIGLGSIVGSAGSFATSLVATGLSAVAALPIRDALQRAVTRYLYGDRDEPVRAIRRLGDRLALRVEPTTMGQTVVDTVADALRLPYVALELGAPPQTRLVAERGARPDDVVARPLVFNSRPLGQLVVGTASPVETLTGSDLRLLDDLAQQVGAAAHAVLLTEDLRASRERIVTGREEERRRLRRDLHDGLGPTLAAIGMRAEAAESLVTRDPDQAAHVLAELKAEVSAAVDDVRRLVDGLRPPALDELGLVGAIRLAAGRLEGTDTPRIRLEADGMLDRLPAAVEVAAYRIVTEALTNAVRHAEARAVIIRLKGDRELRIEVEDDGRGLSADRGNGVGLGSMQERAAELGGECRVEATIAGGTRIVARLPIAALPERPGP